jgi:hypothetical protein
MRWMLRATLLQLLGLTPGAVAEARAPDENLRRVAHSANFDDVRSRNPANMRGSLRGLKAELAQQPPFIPCESPPAAGMVRP